MNNICNLNKIWSIAETCVDTSGIVQGELYCYCPPDENEFNTPAWDVGLTHSAYISQSSLRCGSICEWVSEWESAARLLPAAKWWWKHAEQGRMWESVDFSCFTEWCPDVWRSTMAVDGKTRAFLLFCRTRFPLLIGLKMKWYFSELYRWMELCPGLSPGWGGGGAAASVLHPVTWSFYIIITFCNEASAWFF